MSGEGLDCEALHTLVLSIRIHQSIDVAMLVCGWSIGWLHRLEPRESYRFTFCRLASRFRFFDVIPLENLDVGFGEKLGERAV